MSQSIISQVRFLLSTILLGMGLMLAYDVLRIIRWLIRHSKTFVVVEDLLFWCVVSVPGYLLFLFYNNGEIRWYAVVAIILGAILYEKGISCPVRKIGKKYFKRPKINFNFVRKNNKKCTKK